jgi:hypothetical protein
VLGLGLVAYQLYGLHYLFVPWYSPILASLGALLALLAVTQRTTILRSLVLVLLVAFAGFQWYFLGVFLKLPEYAGPTPGQQMPAFQSAFVDGTSFTDATLRDGKRRALVFFRGRW